MELAIWSFWNVITALPGDSKSQTILHLVTVVLDKEYLGSDEDLDRYWKARLNSSRSHNKAIFTISDVLEKLALPIASVLLAQDENSTSFDSDILNEAGVHESSQDLVRRAKKHGSKGRSCFNWW